VGLGPSTPWDEFSGENFMWDVPFPVVVAECYLEPYAKYERQYQNCIRSGCSIGPAGEDWTGTAGLFLLGANSKVMGLTCGHVLDEVGGAVNQPSGPDFDEYEKKLADRKQHIADDLKKIPTSQHHKFSDLVDEVNIINGKLKSISYDPKSKKPNLVVGRTIVSKMASITWQGVSRNLDVASFEVKARGPIARHWRGGPTG
jgi:hypothetical protein